MLKHVSQSCQDVSGRRSLRQNSFSLDSRLGASAEFLDELELDKSAINVAASAMIVDREYRSFCMTKTGNYSGLVTLPRNNRTVASAASSSANVSSTAVGSSKHQVLTESCLSLPTFSNITAIKVYAQCLRPHLSYKTVIITRHTTSRQVVLGLLSRFRMKHRDPKLFYLTMEVNIGEAASRTIALEDTSCLADLISCNPWGSCRFRLQARQGGLVKVYDGDVRTDSVYKSIIVSHDSTVRDTVDILESCYNLPDNVKLRLYEVDIKTGETRLLDDNDKPLDIKEDWGKGSNKIFRVEKTRGPRKLRNASITQPSDQTVDSSSDMFSRSLVRNTYLRQSVRKKQFLKSMINERNELEAKSFSLSRFNLSDQIISETVEDQEDVGGGCDVVGVGDETRSEGDLNCSTSGVSSLSCSSLDSLQGADQSFYT